MGCYRLSLLCLIPRGLVFLDGLVFSDQIASRRIVGNPCPISLPEDRSSTGYHPGFQ